MNRTLIAGLFACLPFVFTVRSADAQQPDEYCDGLRMLLQSAKDGFARAENFKLPRASTCSVEKDTRSYGCMWAFDKSSTVTASYQQAIQAANACFPNVRPRQSRSARGTLHTEYDFGSGEPLIDISRGRPGTEAGDWYSIDVVAP
ncbi:MAG: hypothetical protein JO204_14415 [Alphaproteobacteria bacterium]|nr:hypothetical protein [Alphaproteobacteria bacterium]